MTELTFGFMDPSRDAQTNSDLFVQMRSLAIKSFANEAICDLITFADDSVLDSHEIISKDYGKEMAILRDNYYHTLSQRNVPIRLPDIQSFFLYSFTLGINKFSFLLMDPTDVPNSRQIPSTEILNRHFPIRGPQWLCNAVNKEMPYLENVFCDFQDDLLKPIMKSSPVNHRLLADAIAGSFLWAFFGGSYWFNEAIDQLCRSISLSEGQINESGRVSFQIKKSMEVVEKDDIKRVVDLSSIYQNGG
jgi:hypothetical protein